MVVKSIPLTNKNTPSHLLVLTGKHKYVVCYKIIIRVIKTLAFFQVKSIRASFFQYNIIISLLNVS